MAHQRGRGCSRCPRLLWGTLPAPWRRTTHAVRHINQPRLNLATGHLPDPAVSLLSPWDSSANALGPWAVQPPAQAASTLKVCPGPWGISLQLRDRLIYSGKLPSAG